MDYDRNKSFFESVAIVNSESPDYSYNKSIEFGAAGNLSTMEIELLGDVKGKSILQFMSHIGAESTALSMLGAKVTGIDMNGQAVLIARNRARQLAVDTNFIVGNCLYAPTLCNYKKFDIVYLGLGSIGWVASLKELFQSAVNCLNPGGRLVLFDIHPIAQSFSTKEKTFDVRASHYKVKEFDEPIRSEFKSSWTGSNGSARIDGFYIWKHTTADIINSVLSMPLRIQNFEEHSYTTYKQFQDLRKDENNRWHFPYGGLFPLTFSLSAIFHQNILNIL